MIKDKIGTGILVGLFADAVKLGFNYAAYLFNFTPVVFWQLTATRFLEKKELFQPLAYVIGGVADVTISALLGVAFVYFIYYLGSNLLWIKGVGFGLIIWVGLFGTLLGQSVQSKLPQSATGIMITLIAHILFGLGLSLFTRLLGQAQDTHDQDSAKSKPETPTPIFKWLPAPSKKNNRKLKKIPKPIKKDS